MVWKWISCTKSNWKPSTSGGPQGLALESILLSIFGRTEQNRTDPQQATAGCGEVGDGAYSGCQAAFQKPSRGWKNGQLRTNELQRQVQGPVFGREQPHEAVLARTDWLESSREQAEPAESWLIISGRCYQPVPLQQRKPPACWAVLAILQQGRQRMLYFFIYIQSIILNFGLHNTRRMLSGWNKSRIWNNVFC